VTPTTTLLTCEIQNLYQHIFFCSQKKKKMEGHGKSCFVVVLLFWFGGIKNKNSLWHLPICHFRPQT
jgi:hypothetical protein